MLSIIKEYPTIKNFPILFRNRINKKFSLNKKSSGEEYLGYSFYLVMHGLRCLLGALFRQDNKLSHPQKLCCSV